MSAKVVVVYIKLTGHVVAALTRTTDADAKIANEIVVAETFRLRSLSPNAFRGDPKAQEFQIPTAELAVGVTEEIAALTSPRTFKVDDPTKDPLVLQKLVAAKEVNPPDAGRIASVALTATKMTVTFEFSTNHAFTKEASVWAIIGMEHDDPQIVPGKIAIGDVTAELLLPFALPAGQHDTLVFAASSAPFVKTFTL